MLEIGTKAPAFELPDQDGNMHTLEEYRGKKVILYFYPKDNTPGCTAEACSLRDGYAQLKAAGYEIVGVSRDSAASHARFAERHELPFTLIADTDLKLNEAFGVWRKKKMAGREYMGTVRTTFIIDENGVVTDVIEKVDTKNSAAQIIDLKK